MGGQLRTQPHQSKGGGASSPAPPGESALWRNTGTETVSGVPPGGIAFNDGTAWQNISGSANRAGIYAPATPVVVSGSNGGTINLGYFAATVRAAWFASITNSTTLTINTDGLYRIERRALATYLTSPLRLGTRYQAPALWLKKNGAAMTYTDQFVWDGLNTQTLQVELRDSYTLALVAGDTLGSHIQFASAPADTTAAVTATIGATRSFLIERLD